MSDFPNGYLTTGNKPVINDAYKASEEYLKEQQRQDNLYNDEGDIYESAINNAFVAGAKWRKQELIGKACLYMFENLHGETLTLRMIDDFKKAMEE